MAPGTFRDVVIVDHRRPIRIHLVIELRDCCARASGRGRGVAMLLNG